MSVASIVVLDAATLDLPEKRWQALTEFGEVTLYEQTPFDDAAILECCRGAKFVLTNKVPMSEAVIGALPDLKMISVLATGYNIINLLAAKRHGVVVCNVPAYSTESVAQHALALIMELCHRVSLHDASVKAGDWCRSPHFSYWHQPVREIADLTIGLVGLGMIGTRVGQMLSVFNCRILAYTRQQRGELNYKRFQWATLETLFAKSDIVSLHCPLNDDNAGFVNSHLLSTMKPSAMLVNTARGGLINEHDLSDALRGGVIAGAAVDVISCEPMREDNPLLRAPNCIITPHIAWSSEASRERLISTTIGNIRWFLKDQPVHVVKP